MIKRKKVKDNEFLVHMSKQYKCLDMDGSSNGLIMAWILIPCHGDLTYGQVQTLQRLKITIIIVILKSKEELEI